MPALSITVLRLLFVLGLYGFLLWSMWWIIADVRYAKEPVIKRVAYIPKAVNTISRLVVHDPDSPSPQVLALVPGQTITFGRASNNTVVVHHRQASSNHCLIREGGDGQWYLEDLASTNHTFLQRANQSESFIVTTPQVLRNGDRIRFVTTNVEVCA